jgi:hypothetical protein
MHNLLEMLSVVPAPVAIANAPLGPIKLVAVVAFLGAATIVTTMALQKGVFSNLYIVTSVKYTCTTVMKLTNRDTLRSSASSCTS